MARGSWLGVEADHRSSRRHLTLEQNRRRGMGFPTIEIGASRNRRFDLRACAWGGARKTAPPSAISNPRRLDNRVQTWWFVDNSSDRRRDRCHNKLEILKIWRFPQLASVCSQVSNVGEQKRAPFGCPPVTSFAWNEEAEENSCRPVQRPAPTLSGLCCWGLPSCRCCWGCCWPRLVSGLEEFSPILQLPSK